MVRQYHQLNGRELEQTPGDSKEQGRLELQRLGHDLATEQQHHQCYTTVGVPRWFSGKESACQCRRRGFDSWVRKIPWILPGEGNGSLLQYCHLGNPTVRGAWWAKSMGSQNSRHDLETKQQ